MPDLEPITREETLLDGGDLTPITRKEMFIKRIYDKNQSVPEPITREEHFLKKAGEGSGGDVTIEQLNVTQNGTYSESGKAYSPVVVNVPAPPVPENAYLLNNLSGLPADIASFNDGTDLPMASLKVTVTPYQDLSHGDPSPENICPIIGWDKAVVTVADDAESPTTSHEYTIDLNGTRYGGTLDVVNGELVVDRVKLTNDYLINTAGYESAGRGCFVLIGITLKTLGSGVVDSKLIASALKTDSQSNLYSQSNIGIAHWWNTRIGFSTGDETITTVSAFKQWLADNGSDVVYELATPITVQLAPTPVKSLEGVNKIFANCGQITEGKYFKRA